MIFEDDQGREFFARPDEWTDGVKRYEAFVATKETSRAAKGAFQIEKD